MARSQEPTDIPRSNYAALSHGPLHALAFVAPILAFYHVASVLTHADPAHMPLVLSHMHYVFRRVGAVAPYLPAMTVAVVLLAQHLAHKDKWAIYPGVLAFMLIESLLWLLPLIALHHMAGVLHQSGALAAQLTVPDTTFGRALLGVAGGAYEEFVFRLVLIELVLLLLVDILSVGKHMSAGVAIALTAVAFGLYHPAVWLADGGFAWWLLLFYVVSGAYLGAVYLRRGLAIVVGAHCMFNIYMALTYQPAG